MTRCSVYFLMAGLILFSSGCGKSSSVADRDDGAQQSATAGNLSDPANSSTQTSTTITAATRPEITVDSTPAEVCAMFLAELSLSEVKRAEKLMTQEAVLQIRNCQLELGPPGGPTAEYRLGETQFASGQQRVAFVPCSVVDEYQTQEFSMMLRHSPHGWKIAGMLFDSEDQGQDLFSFENPVDVAKIKSMMGQEVRQAALSDNLR